MFSTEQFLRSLSPRTDKVGIYRGKWTTVKGSPWDYLQDHLEGRLLLGPRYGGKSVNTVTFMAADVDGPGHGSHSFCDVVHAVHRLHQRASSLGLSRPMVFSSKSGTGFHLYWIFHLPVHIYVASKVMQRLVQDVGGAADRFFPVLGGDGSVLAAPGCGLLGHSGARKLVSPLGGRLVASGGKSSPEALSGAFVRLGLDEPLKRIAAPAKRVHSAKGYAGGALQRAMENVMNCGEGGRNITLAKEAWSLGRFLGGDLDHAEVRDTLMDAAMAAGLSEREAAGVIDRQLLAGYRARG